NEGGTKCVSAEALWRIPLIRDVCWLLALVSAVWIVIALWQIFFPVAIGLLLAYLCHKPLEHFEKCFDIPKRLGAFSIITFTAVALTSLALWMGPTLTGQLQTFIERVPEYASLVEKKTGVDLT